MADGMICRRGGGAASGGQIGAFLDGTITEISDASVTSMRGSYLFDGCSYLTSISLPALSTFPGAMPFSSMTPNLETATFGVTAIAGTYFLSCTKLREVNLPNCVWIASSAFKQCTSLATISMPSLRSIYQDAFRSAALTTASFPSCSMISGYAFGNCSSLRSLYLMGSVVPSLAVTAFYMTPLIESTFGGYGSIYIPASMYDSYMASYTWNQLSSRIVGV